MSDAPPQSIESEEAVLGAMLVAEPALHRVTVEVGLRPEHFYLDRHRAIFGAILRTAAETGTANELLVIAELERRNQLAEAGGKHYVSELAAKVPAAGNARHYAETVLETASLRGKLSGALEVIQGVRERDDERIQAGILAVTTDLAAGSEPTTPEEMADDMLRWLEEGPDEGDLFRLPWPALHEHCAGGFQRGQMILLTGWSGTGKSIVVGQMLKTWGGEGHTALLMTTEMRRREVIARYLAGESGVAYEKIRNRRLSPQDWKKITPPLNRIPFHHHDAEGWDVERILSAIVTKKADVVVVDPVNLIPRTDYHDVTEHARRLKEIAVRANCVVVVVAHLKNQRQREGKKPRPVESDIRDSGMWFANSHYVLALHRKQNEEGKSQREGEIFFMKGREAPEGDVKVEFRPRFIRFDELGTEEREAKEREPELFA